MPLVRDEAVEIDADDFCQCDWPSYEMWKPNVCNNCKRLILWDDSDGPFGD